MPGFRPLLLLIAVGLTATRSTENAFAQGAESESGFAEGNRLYAAEKFEDAITAFRREISRGGPHADYARLDLAKCLRRLGRFAEAGQALDSIHSSAIPDAAADEARALLDAAEDAAADAYEKPDYARAAQIYDFLRAFRPEESFSYFFGMSDYYLGRYRVACPIFSELAKTAQDKEIHDNSEKLVPLCREATAPYPTTGTLEAGAGYNQNVFAGAPGFPVIDAPVADLSATFQIPYERGDRSSYWIDLFLQDDEVIGYPQYRTLTASLGPKFRWSFDGGYSLDTGPEGTIQSVGTDLYAMKAGVNLHVSRTWTSDTVTAGGYVDKDFGPSGPYAYTEGSSSLLSAAYDHQMGIVTLEGSFNYWIESSQNYVDGPLLFPLSYTGPSVGLSVQLAGPEPWSFVARTNYYWRSFTPDEQPDNEARIDHAIDFSLRADYRISAAFGAFASAYLTQNSSTLGADTVADENFTQYRLVLGGVWRFLR